MKEKETATCPICGGELQVQGKALFKEHHKRLWEEIAENLGVVDTYEYNFGQLYHGGYSRMGIVENKPMELIRCEKQNPTPELDLTWFVVALANRVAALETALAEKGGAR